MAIDITPDRLRSLAATRPRNAKVLSLFVNLDPREFATGPARRTQARSLIDRAAQVVKDARDLSHQEREGLKADLRRVEAALGGGYFDAKGAHGLAVYASSPVGLFEMLKLAKPVDHEPVVGDTPFLEPLTQEPGGDEWCVLLANRRVARLVCGTPANLEEVELVEDEVHGQHDQGGWSQARYQRSVDKDVADHLKHVAEVTFTRLKDRLPAGILVGTPQELAGDLESALHPYLRERLAGRIDVDVEHSTLDDVRRLAGERIDAAARRRENAALQRVAEGFAAGGAVGNLPDVLEALTEQRVETLLVDRGFRAPGRLCPACGLLAADGDECPVDGTPLRHLDDIVEVAVERAVTQSASVLVLDDRPELGPHRHIAAVLRF